MARKAESYDNQKLSDYLLRYDSYSEVNPLIKTGIEGSCYLGNPTHPTSPRVIFRALQCLPEVNFESVKDYINRKEVALEGKEFSRRHTYYMFERIRSAKKSVEYLYRNVLDSYEPDTNYICTIESSPE